jgi:lipid-binding SYLF domain-containing protein
MCGGNSRSSIGPGGLPRRICSSCCGPVFLTIAGGSFGLQIGGTSDLVLVFRNREGFQHLLKDKFKIGRDLTAAAGPVGRTAGAATDLEMHAEILTYSRSRGVFAGVSLDGSVVAPDHGADGHSMEAKWTVKTFCTVRLACRTQPSHSWRKLRGTQSQEEHPDFCLRSKF